MKRNLSVYTVEHPDGSKENIQEVHPEKTSPSPEEILNKVQWIQIAGGATAEAIMKILPEKMPKKRIFIRVSGDLVGEVGFYPKLTKREKNLLGVDTQS